MQIEHLPGETVLKVGGASLVRGHDSIAGRLYLTTARLHFAPHLPGIDFVGGDVPLADVATVLPGKSGILGVPLVRDQMIINASGGERVVFRVSPRDAWIDAVKRAVRGEF